MKNISIEKEELEKKNKIKSEHRIGSALEIKTNKA